MKYSQVRRWLERQGAIFSPGRGSHHKVELKGRTSVFPDHGGEEIGMGLVKMIKNDPRT